MFVKKTYRWINDALVQIQAGGGVRAHHQPTGTDAGVAARRVDTLAPVARVLQARALVNIRAGPSVHQQHVAGIAAAAVGPGGVKADIIALPVAGRALINVLAGEATACLAVALVADALVGAHHVLAGSIGADAAGQAALVDVLAVAPVLSQLMASWTLALEVARCVDAAATTA